MEKNEVNIYEARKNYIKEIGDKLISYQKKGYLIFNNDNEIVENISQTGFDVDKFGLTIDSCVFYEHNKDIDNGYYTPMKEMKAMFKGFKIVNPKYIIKL